MYHEKCFVNVLRIIRSLSIISLLNQADRWIGGPADRLSAIAGKGEHRATAIVANKNLCAVVERVQKHGRKMTTNIHYTEYENSHFHCSCVRMVAVAKPPVIKVESVESVGSVH